MLTVEELDDRYGLLGAQYLYGTRFQAYPTPTKSLDRTIRRSNHDLRALIRERCVEERVQHLIGLMPEIFPGTAKLARRYAYSQSVVTAIEKKENNRIAEETPGLLQGCLFAFAAGVTLALFLKNRLR